MDTKTNSTYPLYIAGMFCAIISIIFFPLLFGIVGLIFGFLIIKDNQAEGLIIICLNVICMVLGMLWGLSSYLKNFG